MALHSGQRRGLRGTLVVLNTGEKQKLRAGWALRNEGDNGYLPICVPDTGMRDPAETKRKCCYGGPRVSLPAFLSRLLHFPSTHFKKVNSSENSYE